MKKFSWRDEFGIFFDSAERHDSQRLAHSRAGEATWFANLLHDINRGGSGLCHKPKVHTYLNLDNNVGLTNVLAGLDDISTAIKKHPSGFDYIPSGHTPPNPVELLSSTKMEELLEKLSQSYDYIFIDTPPVMIVTDAAALAKYATGVILVAKYMFTTRENLEKAISNLKFANANILGILLNSSAYAKRRTYKKAYSRKYYKYYKYYGYEYTYGNNSLMRNNDASQK